MAEIPSTNTEYGEHVIHVDTTGAGGSGAGNSDSTPAFGFVYQISVNFNASAPATTNVYITHILRNGITQTLGYLENQNSDIVWSPQYDTTTIGPIPTVNGGKRWPLVLDSTINVSVTDCDALTDAVVVSIQVI